MENTYIVKLKKDKLICFFYLNDEGIAYKVYENNYWSKTEVIFRNALENYTVSLAEDRTIYIFCQDIGGNLFVCTNPDGVWKNKLILENKSKKINKVIFYPIISENNITLIYNVPESDNRPGFLVSQSINNLGKWSEPVNIDNYIQLQNSIFQVQQVAKDHVLLFYQNRTGELRIGYRELTSSLQGPFNVFHQTTFQIRDQSFLTTNEEIHFCYIVKTYFSSQLIYRKKTDNGFTKPKVLWEAQRLSKCVLSIIKDKLYIYCISNNNPLEIISNDLGETFEKPAEAKGKFSAESEKAFFISEYKLDESDYFLREILVNSEKPWDIQIIPNLVNDFFPVALKTAERVEKQIKVQNEDEYQGEINELKEYLSKMKNQLLMAKRMLEEKDRQIISMTTLLKNKNDELAELNYEFLELKKHNSEPNTSDIDTMDDFIGDSLDYNHNFEI